MRHERRRWVGLVAVTLLFGAALAGCGGSAAPPPESVPPPGHAGPVPPSGVSQPGVPPAGPGGAVPADPRLASAAGEGALTTGWRYRFDMVSPANERNAIRERAVDLYFWPDTTRVWFQLQNRVGAPIKILWNEFRFRDTDNRVFKVVHEGIQYERRNDPLDYTLVAGNQRYSDWFAPVDRWKTRRRRRAAACAGCSRPTAWPRATSARPSPPTSCSRSTASRSSTSWSSRCRA